MKQKIILFLILCLSFLQGNGQDVVTIAGSGTMMCLPWIDWVHVGPLDPSTGTVDLWGGSGGYPGYNYNSGIATLPDGTIVYANQWDPSLAGFIRKGVLPSQPLAGGWLKPPVAEESLYAGYFSEWYGWQFIATSVAADKFGNIFFCDGYNAISKINTSGEIHYFGVGGRNYDEPGSCGGLAVDEIGDVYTVQGNAIVKLDRITGASTIYAGSISTAGFSGDGSSATDAVLNCPKGIAVDHDGNIYVADAGNHRVRKISGGLISTIAGGGSSMGDDGPATDGQLDDPIGVSVDKAGNVYVTDRGQSRIRKISTVNIISTITGTGVDGTNGDGVASATQVWEVRGCAIDENNDLLFIDARNVRIKKVVFTTAVPSNICSGTSSVLTATAAGTGGTYSWLPTTGLSSAVGATVTASPTVTTIYTVTGTDIYGGTTINMVKVTVNTPMAYSVTGGGGYCTGGSGVAVGLSNSQIGVSYQLYNGTTAVGAAMPGTGSAISFGIQTTAGVYTVVATNVAFSCTNNMSGSATVTVNALPTAYNVTGSGHYCFGGTGVAVGLDHSEYGVNYQLYNGTSTIGSPVPGDVSGAAIIFGLQTASGTYTVVATNTTTGCSADMSGDAVITIDPLPTAYNVTGGGSYCEWGIGQPINLSNSQNDVTYQLYNGSTPVGTPLPGTTGSALFYGLHTDAGAYSIIATNVITGCTNTMTGSATVVITINPLPTAFTVSDGGSYCVGGSGVEIILSGFEASTTYQLYSGSLPFGGLVTGTLPSSPLSLGFQTVPGTYQVVATNTTTTCNAFMTGTASVSTDPLPIVHNVTGGGNYCTGGAGLAITLDASQNGINYQLYSGVSAVGIPVPGNSTGAGLSFGLQTASGTYSVVATNGTTGCQETMFGSPTVTVDALPTAFTVSGGGHYCASVAGASISLTGSQLNIDYMLYNGSILVNTEHGTGFSINFGLWPTGTYSVVAINTLLPTACTNSMTGSVTAIEDPLPATQNVTGGGNYCAGGSGLHIGLLSSQTGVNYQLLRDGTAVPGAILPGADFTALDFGAQTTGGNYTVMGTNSISSCANNMTGPAIIIVDPLPVAYSVTGTGSYCAGGSGLPVGLSNSETGVNYQLYNGVSTIGTAVAGTGVAITFGLQTAAGAYTVVATNAATSCIKNMTGSATITINPLPAVTAPASQVRCFNTLVAATTFTGTGTSYTWTNSDPSIGLGASGTGNIGSFTGLNGTSDIHDAIITVTPVTTATGCAGPVQTFTLTVVPPLTLQINETSPIQIRGDKVYTYCSSTSLPFTQSVTSTPALPSTGVVYTWHPSTGSNYVSPDTSIAPTAPSANTYYTVTAVYGCTASTTDTVVVPGSCSPCEKFMTFATSTITAELKPFHTIGGGLAGPYNVSAAMLPGNGSNIYFPSSVNMTGTIDVNDMVILMNTNKVMNIPEGADASFHHSHLFSCDNWKGVVVGNGPTNFGILRIDNNSLVEKADIAISYNTATLTAAPGANAPYLVHAVDNIFNDNGIGISLKYVPDVTITPTPSDVMPFTIYGNTFTGRNFSTYSYGLTTYPFIWPTSALLQTDSIANAYHPILKVDGFTATTAIGTGASPSTGIAKIGVELLGSKTVGGSSRTYYKFRIGAQDASGSFGANLFDRLVNNGITSNCNFELRNNIFRDIQPYTTSSAVFTAIAAVASGTNQALMNNGEASSSIPGNRIYSCWDRAAINSAVYLKDYANLSVSHTTFAKENTTAGRIAVRILASSYDTVSYKFNNTCGYSTGVVMTVSSPGAGSNGFIYLDTNVFSSTYWDGSGDGPTDGATDLAAGNFKLSRAIDLNDLKSTSSGPYNEIGNIYITGNRVYGADNYAFYLQNFHTMPLYIDHNYISLYYRSPTFSSGIVVSSSKKADATNNTVHGTAGVYSSTGIQYQDVNDAGSSSSNISNITCNRTYNLYRGFGFLYTNTVNWRNNVMANSRYGLFLSTAATMGPQGGVGNPIDNYWDNTGNWWTTGMVGLYHVNQTYVNDAGSAAGSVLYVRSTPITYNPNGTYSNAGGAAYATGTTIITTTGTSSYSCPDSGPKEFNGGEVINNAATESYHIFPNPNDGNMTISNESGSDGVVDLIIVNAVGATVYQSKMEFAGGRSVLQLNDVAPGLYLVEILDNSGHRFTQRLIVQK